MKSRQQKLDSLIQAISLLQTQQETHLFFADLCTPAELEAMADRWQVVPLIREGIPYRTIHEQTGVSVATITRIARCINMGSGGYNLMAERIKKV